MLLWCHRGLCVALIQLLLTTQYSGAQCPFERTTSKDLQRAAQPRATASHLVGPNAAEIRSQLNRHNVISNWASVRPCSQWGEEELDQLFGKLWAERSCGLGEVYNQTDGRALLHSSLLEYEARWARRVQHHRDVEMQSAPTC